MMSFVSSIIYPVSFSGFVFVFISRLWFFILCMSSVLFLFCHFQMFSMEIIDAKHNVDHTYLTILTTFSRGFIFRSRIVSVILPPKYQKIACVSFILDAGVDFSFFFRRLNDRLSPYCIIPSQLLRM